MNVTLPTGSQAAYLNATVFLSHKVNDKKVTGDLKDLLDRHTENVKYFVSEEIAKGVDFRKDIADHLTDSSCLILVFTDPNEDWGWCLYETGFFDALSRLDPKLKRRIYCLHNASTRPPSPLADLQTVPAIKKDVEQWLSELFELTRQTKKTFLADIPELAEEICELFANNPRLMYSQRSIQLKVNGTLLKSPDDLPDNTAIEGDDGLMRELFGAFDGKTNWKTVKKRFRQFPNSVDVNIGTLKEISRAIYAIYNGNIVHQVHGVIFVEQGPKRYSPVINYVKQLTANLISCDILFINAVGGQLQNVDKPLAALLTSVRLAVRIRWEIIRPFTNVRKLAQLDARKLRSDLQTCFNNVFLEAEFRGHFYPEDILKAFEEDEDKTRFLEIRDRFDQTLPKIWRGIGFSDVTETFGEVSDKPMSDQDLSLLESGLKELEQENGDFLKMAVVRALVLIQRELGNEI